VVIARKLLTGSFLEFDEWLSPIFVVCEEWRLQEYTANTARIKRFRGNTNTA